MENYEILWKNMLDQLEAAVGRISFVTYIQPLRAIDLVDGALILESPSEMQAKFLLRWTDKISAVLKEKAGISEFRIYVHGSQNLFYSSFDSEEEDSSPIDSRYTFDSFVVGQSNRYLYAAAKAVAADPGKSYNPLFIYGGTGLGKTHIMHAIANALRENRPELKLIYATCEKFTNDLIATIRQGKAYDGSHDFREKYRSVDVLIIDDVQFLSKKQSTQEEFFHTFNELYEKGKQIILSADCQPKEIDLLEDRLRTRFQSGLMVEVLPPDVETKIAILQKKAEEKKSFISLEVASYLAELSGMGDVRSLEGLLNKVIFASQLKETPITLELAKEAISLSRPSGDGDDVITTDRIISAVCSFYKIKKSDLLGKRKTREIVLPRQVCTYLITDMMDIPLVSVGQAMGGRDHTTVMYTRDTIAAKIKTDQKLATEISDVKNLIKRQ